MKRRKGKERERGESRGKKERAKSGTLVGLKDLTADLGPRALFRHISLGLYIMFITIYTLLSILLWLSYKTFAPVLDHS